MMAGDRSLDQKKQQIWFSTISDMGNPFLVSKMKKNVILLLFYSLKSGSSCQYIGTEQLMDIIKNYIGIGYYTGPVNSADSTGFTGPDKTHSLVLKHAT